MSLMDILRYRLNIPNVVPKIEFKIGDKVKWKLFGQEDTDHTYTITDANEKYYTLDDAFIVNETEIWAVGSAMIAPKVRVNNECDCSWEEVYQYGCKKGHK